MIQKEDWALNDMLIESLKVISTRLSYHLIRFDRKINNLKKNLDSIELKVQSFEKRFNL